MTRKDTLDAIKALGMSARYSTEWGEYRVTLRAEDEPSRERREAMAYYTDDAKDALGTARAMRETFDQQQAAKAEGPELEPIGLVDPEILAEEMAIRNAEAIGIAQAEATERTAFTVDDIPPSPLYEQTERGTFRVTDAARAGIEALAAALPDAERQTEGETFEEVLQRGDVVEVREYLEEAFGNVSITDAQNHLDAFQQESAKREPSEAEVTRHMMTGEEPRTASPLDKARERNNTPEAKAARLAERQAMPSRGYDGPEL